MSNTTTYEFDTNAPFFQFLAEGRKTYVGGSEGGNYVNTAVIKLNFAVSGMRMFCNGLKPTGSFRLKDVKAFYGVKGNKQKVYESLLALSQAIAKGHVPS